MSQCCRVTDLRCKEVINLYDGCRLGFVGDVEVDTLCGRVVAIVIPAPFNFFGLFGKHDDYVIAWEQIEKIGDDIILVRYERATGHRERKKWWCFMR